MRRSPRLAWLLLLVWGTWLFALQGLAASSPRIGAWAPDVGILLLFALEGRHSAARTRWAALIVAAARIGFSAESALAILCAYLGVAAAMRSLRRVVEVDRGIPRALLAGLGAFAAASLWILCHRLQLLDAGRLAPQIELPWRCAAATALLSLPLVPLLRRLPGLTPLMEPRT